MNMLLGMKIKAKKSEVLHAIRTNLMAHTKIVREAQEGYVAAAKKALTERLEQLQSGKIASLSFRLSPPQDHLEDYRTALQMLELDVSELVELTAQQVECLIRDKWDWKQQFLAINSAYSNEARAEIGALYGVEYAGD
jgi:hypothetical protein